MLTRSLALVAAVGVCFPLARAASVEEPATVFYGRITGTASAQPFLLTEGELRWTLRRASGQPLELQANLWPIKDGEYSYRLDVPHEALIQGFAAAPHSVALTPVEETLAITGIRVNDVAARLAGPTADTFDVDQARRAATYRLDLEVPLTAPDSDGDGLPDWWDTAHGGDLKPGDDLDGDGLDNLAEYLAGTNPRVDSRRPTLITTRIQAYADGLTGVYLRAVDSDTEPEDLTYTLTRLPEGAELRLRNAQAQPADPDVALTVGATFTQRDVLDGRLVLAPAGDESLGHSSFDVTLREQASDASAVTASIAVEFYRPSMETLALLGETGPPTPSVHLTSVAVNGLSRDEALRVRSYLLGKDQGGVLWDYCAESAGINISVPTSGLDSSEYENAYVQRFGREHPQALLGGVGPDVLRGGMADDLLSGGAGENQLTGGGGRDRFLFGSAGAARDTLTDFRPEQGDVLDFEALLNGASRNLRDYLRVTVDANGGRLGVDRDGDGSGYTDLTVTFPGVPADALDLHSLVESGALAVGKLSLPSRISIAASLPVARENGPKPGEFLLSRTGSLDDLTTVQLEVRGSAVNGVDFASVQNVVTFAAGARTARVAVTPYADNQAEPAETVELTVVAGDGYEVGPTNRAEVTIADLQPVVSVEALEAFATTDPMSPGTLLVSRNTVIDRSLLVRLDFGGSAASGSDYQGVSKFVNLTPGQTTALISIVPNGAALPVEEAKSVLVSVLPDPSYLVGATPRAEVLLVRRQVSLAAWRAEHFPNFAGSLAEFRAADPGGKGIPAAMRYAFGMDPENPDRARLPKVVLRDGHLTIDVWRRPGATDVELLARAGSDLRTWSSGPDVVERFYPPEQAGNPEVICFRTVSAVAEAPHLFVNLRVSFHP